MSSETTDEQRTEPTPHFSITRRSETWTITCAGELEAGTIAELERLAKSCLAEWPLSLRFDLTKLTNIGADGVASLGDIVSECQERGVPVRMYLSMKTPVHLIVGLDDRIRDRSRADAVGLGGSGPSSFRFENGGVVISV